MKFILVLFGQIWTFEYYATYYWIDCTNEFVFEKKKVANHNIEKNHN